MSDRLLVGTKKGLFELRRTRGDWSIAGTRFLGDPISMLLHDPRDGALYAAEALGHFGVKLQRSRDGGETWQEIAAPAFPKSGTDGPSVSYLFCLETGWRRPAGLALVRHDPRRAVPVEGPRRVLDAERGAVEPAAAQGLDGRRVRRRRASPRSASIRAGPAHHHRRLHRRRLDHRRWRRDLARLGRWDVCRLLPAERAPRARGAGHPPPGAVPRGAGHAVGAAPQRRVPLHRCARGPGRRSPRSARRSSASRWRCIRTIPTRRGSCPASRTNAASRSMRRLVVARTRDGARSFDVLTEGLPQSHAYDLVYRHALDVDDTGDAAGDGLDHGTPVGVGECRRPLDPGGRPPAADQLRALRIG